MNRLTGFDAPSLHTTYVDKPMRGHGLMQAIARVNSVFQAVTELSHAVVGDKSKPVEERRFALRFLLHCVQDMHQPCHVGENHDKGGNLTRIRWFDRGSNIHSVWDSGIIERAGKSEDFWLADLAELDTAENRKAWMAGAVEEWDTESLLAARAAYVVPGTEARIK